MIKSVIRPALVAGIALAALSTPATAQVGGIATVRPAAVIAASAALNSGYQQIATTYTAQIQQIQTLGTQRQQLLQSLDTNGNGQVEELDTNGDGQVDQAEQNANPTIAQVAALEQQISAAEQPVQLAQAYVVAQVGQQYGAAAQQVISDRSIQVLLSPEAVVFANEGFDVSELVTTALNNRLPTVTVTPPAGWAPDESVVGLYQQVMQLRAMAARAQAAQAASAQPAAGEVPPR
jgi:Skp family chaperone for outer membrane proteins